MTRPDPASQGLVQRSGPTYRSEIDADAPDDDPTDDRPIAILLVEDDHGDAVLVQASLSDVGVPDSAVSWTRTLGEALDELAEHPPDCVLLDLGLPDSDGFSAVHKMVAAAPDMAIIVLTGRQERDGVDALAAGAQDYLAKDALTGELLDRSMRYAMERKRAQLTQQQLREVRLSAAEQERLERGLLPRPLLASAPVTAATYYRPGRDDAVLGGDFYDIVEVGDGRVRAIIGDVMGHGPDEAALGVHLRVAWRTLLLAGASEDRMLPVLETLLRTEEDQHRHFVTVCDMTIDTRQDGGATLTLRIAGHPAPVVSSADASVYLDGKVGPPLGVGLPGADGPLWEDTVVELDPGFTIVAYTDGLLERYAAYESSRSLGIDELVDGVNDCVRSGRPAAEWISALVGGAPRDSVDDTAVLVLTAKQG